MEPFVNSDTGRLSGNVTGTLHPALLRAALQAHVVAKPSTGTTLQQRELASGETIVANIIGHTASRNHYLVTMTLSFYDSAVDEEDQYISNNAITMGDTGI